jgi:hypothetical protein
MITSNIRWWPTAGAIGEVGIVPDLFQLDGVWNGAFLCPVPNDRNYNLRKRIVPAKDDVTAVLSFYFKPRLFERANAFFARNARQ